MVNASSTITIHGQLTVHHMGDPVEVILPVQNARIDIYDEEIIQYPITGWGHLPWPDTYLGTVYTDSNGYYTFTVSNDDGSTLLGDEHGRDIYLMVRATNARGTVRNNPEFVLGSIFEYKAGTYADLADGESLEINLRPTSANYQVAFEILSNIDKAWRHVRDETGIEVAKVNVFYEDFFANDCSYYMPDKIGDYLGVVPTPTLPTGYFPPELISFLTSFSEIGPIEKGIIRDVSGIHFTDILTDRFYEIIYHEYGHHVMNELFELGPPFSVFGTHHLDTEYTPQHAWVEGWAEFYSSASRKYLGIPDYLNIAGTINIEDLDYDYTEDKAWDSVEGNIAGILWDIHDEENESFDDLSLSFGEVVAFIQSYDPAPGVDQIWPLWADTPWNIYHVFDACRHYYNYDISVSNLWTLYEASGIDISDTVPPQNPTSYISSHNSVIPLNNPIITVDLLGAFDSLSGVDEYYYYWRFESVNYDINDPETRSWIENNWDTSSVPHFEFDTSFDLDEWYLYVITRDKAGNFAEEVFTAGPFKIQELYTLQIDGIVSTSFGEIFGTQFTQVTVPTLEYPGKNYEFPVFHIYTSPNDEEPIPFSGSFNLEGKEDGLYQLAIFGVESDTSDQLFQFPISIDNTESLVEIILGSPNYEEGINYVSRDTLFTILAEDYGSGIKTIEYSLTGSDWLTYNGAFKLPALEDGLHTIYARAFDYLGNTGYSEQVVELDNTSPEILASIGDPKQSIQVTCETLFTIEAIDQGCGLHSMRYKLFTEYEPDDWTPYTGAFNLPEEEGEYTIIYQASDNLENMAVDELSVINDNSGPQLQILSPTDGSALQDIVTFNIDAVDPSGVESVKITIRATGEPDMPIGFEDVDAIYDSNLWALQLNTFYLFDGDYIVILSSHDGLGNSATLQAGYSVRNGAIIELLPATLNSKAGRTMPIKFSLRVSSEVDPLEPFVYNENLVIKIYAKDHLQQESTFGTTAVDYRITEDDHYITNFKTLKTRELYTVNIYRMDFLIGSFTFNTPK